MTGIEERVSAIADAGSIDAALDRGSLCQYEDLSCAEALILGFLRQGVRKFIVIFGHGTTHIGEVLRYYQERDLVSVYNVRHETEASHIASALRWQYNERSAVFTSIGPGAMQAFAGSLVSASNGLGIYYVFGDETTHDEGYNMQQIPRSEQSLFLKTMSHMSDTYSLQAAESLPAALKRGIGAVFNPSRERPFFLLAPMNVQAQTLERFNLSELPIPPVYSSRTVPPATALSDAAGLIRNADRICLKAGRGAGQVSSDCLEAFLEKSGAVYVHGPAMPGLIPWSHDRNMGVGGSKGSICGNYAMENADLVISLGARAVCQWDSSGTAWQKARHIISINTDFSDATHYNRTLALQGDAGEVLSLLTDELGDDIPGGDAKAWQTECLSRKNEWISFRNLRFENPVIFDEKQGRDILSQPAAIKCVVDFCDRHHFPKYFDAGDVQANGFQITDDEKPGMTYTETGASYMGFAVSGLLSSAIADEGRYTVAFTGDGSFMMNPQVLLDGIHLGVHGMIVLFDNRRMAAISNLQWDQYGEDFRTDDRVEVDYVAMAGSVSGVRAFQGGETMESLNNALEEAMDWNGLSLVHVPVYAGRDELGGLGAFGNWNVGNWCDRVQKEKHRLGL